MMVDPPMAPPAAPSISFPAAPPTALCTIAEGYEEFEYKDDVELEVNAPTTEDDSSDTKAPHKHLHTASVNPSTLLMLSDTMYLLEPTAPPMESKPTGTRNHISTKALLLFSTDPVAPPPNVRTCTSPNVSDSLQDFTSEKIYYLSGNHRFRNYEHFCQASKEMTFVQGGKPCTFIGEFANTCKRNCGKTLPPTKRYLDKVHLYIIYVNITSNLGYCYDILLIDRSTKYLWFTASSPLSQSVSSKPSSSYAQTPAHSPISSDAAVTSSSLGPTPDAGSMAISPRPLAPLWGASHPTAWWSARGLQCAPLCVLTPPRCRCQETTSSTPSTLVQDNQPYPHQS
jgi:hypothetical protein